MQFHVSFAYFTKIVRKSLEMQHLQVRKIEKRFKDKIEILKIFCKLIIWWFSSRSNKIWRRIKNVSHFSRISRNPRTTLKITCLCLWSSQGNVKIVESSNAINVFLNIYTFRWLAKFCGSGGGRGWEGMIAAKCHSGWYDKWMDDVWLISAALVPPLEWTAAEAKDRTYVHTFCVFTSSTCVSSWLNALQRARRHAPVCRSHSLGNDARSLTSIAVNRSLIPQVTIELSSASVPTFTIDRGL